MINLNGPDILFYAIGTQASAAQQSLIEEWFSPSFHDWEVLVYGAMLLILAMLVVSNRRIRARDVGARARDDRAVAAVRATHRVVRCSVARRRSSISWRWRCRASAPRVRRLRAHVADRAAP